jgi:rubrerythrin
LARELATINNYQTLRDKAHDQSVADFLDHIIDEEKEHVAEALELIKRLDPKQAARLAAGYHVTSRHKRDGSESLLTVGSLRPSRKQER